MFYFQTFCVILRTAPSCCSSGRRGINQARGAGPRGRMMTAAAATVEPGKAVGHDDRHAEEERAALGARLRKVRRYLELSQLEVAQHLQLPRSALSHIENGRRGLDALELKRLAGLYQYPVSYFTGEVNPAEGLEEALEPLLQTAADLSRNDREEVRHFAEYLRARKEYDESSQS